MISQGKKPKAWHAHFVVDYWSHQLQYKTWQGNEGDWVVSLTVFSKATGDRVTDRFYSTRIDACRGAAQIYNQVEKRLLG